MSEPLNHTARRVGGAAALSRKDAPALDAAARGSALAWPGAILAALILNALFFGLMPGLLGRVPEKAPGSRITTPVRIERLSPPESEPERAPQARPEKPLEAAARPVHRVPAPKTPPLPMQAPAPVPLDLNPALPPASAPAPVPFFRPLTLPEAAVESPLPLAPVAEGPFSLARVDAPPRPLGRRPPLYPLRAQRMGVEGRVVVELTVTRAGGVKDVVIVEAEPKGFFEEAALKTAASWRFAPGTLKGRPVETRLAQPIIFQLEN